MLSRLYDTLCAFPRRSTHFSGFKNQFDSDSEDEGQRVVKSKKDRL